jgi:phosphoribosylamine--glycine ligase
MNILIIGSGGREHALGWKLRQSPQVRKIYFAPGNGGTHELGQNINIKATDINALLTFVKINKVDLTIVGPEDPLSMGIVDLFNKHNVAIFGPSRNAAQLESSKTWATAFMKKYAVPHPISYTFTDYKKSLNFISSHDMRQFVIKASGLALGKGVFLPSSENDAKESLKRIMIDLEFGEAGKEVLIQERLVGFEVSLMAITDGKTIKPFISAQDHKRISNNDKGANTGGMGAYAPVPFVDKKLLRQIETEILQPTVDGMNKEGIPYKGILYAGLMITKEGPKVLEYNVRFGDPETQPIMMLLKSNLLPLFLSSINGTLKSKRISFYKKVAACIVLASKGYPGVYEKGIVIKGLQKKIATNGTFVFHAGTVMNGKDIVTNGGRVLGITGVGSNMNDALKNAYSIIGKKGVYFSGMQYRTDIGKKAIINTPKV